MAQVLMRSLRDKWTNQKINCKTQASMRGKCPASLHFSLYILRLTQASINTEDFNPYPSFKSKLIISVPMVCTIRPCQPNFLTCFTQSLIATWRRQICFPLIISWFLLQLCSFDCLKTKTFLMEWPDLVNKYLFPISFTYLKC